MKIENTDQLLFLPTAYLYGYYAAVGIYNIIRNFHERCLGLVCNAKNSSYEGLLTKDDSVSIHHRNIQALATELYKIKNGLSPESFAETFARETLVSL